MTISNLTKNGKKLSKQVEITCGKGEIARFEQFLLFPQCFQKASFPGTSKSVIVWEWVNCADFFFLPNFFHRNIELIDGNSRLVKNM